MRTTRLEDSDILLVQGERHSDERGHLTVIWDHSIRELQSINFVMTKYSSSHSGVLRGLHYQLPPMGQGKLVCILQGRVFFAAVDIRTDSPKFGKAVTTVLSTEEPKSIWVPEGYALGSLSLKDSLILYHLTKHHSPDREAGVRWDDPALEIPWPSLGALSISERDQTLPRLGQVEAGFIFSKPH
jgi:dTDP-4-dehydrorhamnose 3,5-epimerase